MKSKEARLNQLTFSFWEKRSPLLRFLAKSDEGWEVFEKEMDAIRWAARRTNGRVETIIL